MKKIGLVICVLLVLFGLWVYVSYGMDQWQQAEYAKQYSWILQSEGQFTSTAITSDKESNLTTCGILGKITSENTVILRTDCGKPATGILMIRGKKYVEAPFIFNPESRILQIAGKNFTYYDAP